MRYLYKKTKKNDESEFSGELTVEVFTPKILCKLTLKGEKKSFKLLAVRFWFQIITHGKAKIYYIRQGENLVHTSYVVPKCYKFSFLNTNDYEIGPCFTYPEYRGKGVYPFVLKKYAIVLDVMIQHFI